jgi:broad specificity phosphatase PhoE
VTTVYLARHGESDWNVVRRWQGHADRPLTDTGREQARALAERLEGAGIEAVYSSDLLRAKETAATVADRLGLELHLLPELREVDVGSWSGLTREEAEERFPAAFERWGQGGAAWEDGESHEQMAARVLTAVRRIAKRHPGGRVLIVAHGGPIRAVHAAALGIELHEHRRARPVEPNARLSVVAVEGGRITRID